MFGGVEMLQVKLWPNVVVGISRPETLGLDSLQQLCRVVYTASPSVVYLHW